MSKGLEALEELDSKYGCFALTNEYRLVSIIEKELKALEIIKSKRVDVEWFCQALKIQSCKPIEYYNRNDSDTDLTQDEFDLLKEVLNND